MIKAAGDGEVVIDGAGNNTLFNLLAANCNHFDGITVKNTNVAFLLGIKDINGADGITLINPGPRFGLLAIHHYSFARKPVHRASQKFMWVRQLRNP